MARSSNTARPYRPKRMGTSVAVALGPVLNKPAAKHGFRDARLLAEWSVIVGEQLASRTRPDRLDRRGSAGTLRLIVAPGWQTEVQHSEPLILQKINQFFGHQMVHRLVLRQGPVMQRAMKPRPAPAADLSPDREQALLNACADVEDQELAVILERLGRSVLK